MRRLLLLLFVLFQCLPASAYEDKGRRFRVTPPPGWSPAPDKAKKIGALAVFMGPLQSSAFMANINVMEQAVGDLETFNKISVQQIQRDGTIVSQRSLTLGGVPAREIVWKARMQGQDLQFHSTFWTKNGRTYLYTGTSLQSKWKSVAPALRQSAATFRPVP
jgi:hypothetical protein